MNRMHFLLLTLLLALSAQAAPIAFEPFDYRIGVLLEHGNLNGGNGWSGGWQSEAGKEMRMASEQASLWFGNEPAYNQDLTDHIRGEKSDLAIRDWATPVDLQTADLYFAALVRFEGTHSYFRAEFYDGAGATGNMGLNVGLKDYDGDANVDLFVDGAEDSYPVSAVNNTVLLDEYTTYLLVAKRDQAGVSASLLPGDGSAPVEPVVWDVAQSNASSVALQSMKMVVSDGRARFDELCIATNFTEAVAGLQTAVETDWFLTYPVEGETVYQTIPYFEWTDAVPHPYAGTYQIQIAEDSSFTDLFDEDRISAIVSWYSPTNKFERGRTYYWRVRYEDEAWSQTESFSIGFPHVIDVLPSDGWDEIQAKYAQAVDYGSAHTQAAELRFPVNHTFNLVQDPVDDYLLDYPSDGGNFIINGQGSTLILECTKLPYNNENTVIPRCGFISQKPRQSDIQIHDIVIDYHPNSLNQFGGVISNFDKKNGTFTVTVDTNVYANFAEAASVNEATLMYADNQARVQDDTHVYTKETWGEAQQSDTTFNFTFDPKPSAALKAELNDGDYLLSSPLPKRGGQMFDLDRNMSDNFLVNNVTTKAVRGILIRGIPYHGRFVNCNFLRTPGRLRGGASGGVNHQTDYAWYENLRFEYMRDDSFHNGGSGAYSVTPGEVVFRNNEVIGGYRASIWVQMDRQWVANNVVRHAGGNAIFIGRSGVSNTENDQVDVGLIENNQIFGVRGGFVSGVHTTADPDPATGLYNRYLTIRNNTIYDTTKNQAFDLSYLRDCVVESNRVVNTIPNWSAFSDPSLQIGFYFFKSLDINGSGNRVEDERLTLSNHKVIGSGCKRINVEVIDGVTVQVPSDITNRFSTVADAYVRDGAPTANYGTATSMRCKYDSGGSFSRQSFLRFDLSAQRGIVERATLRIKVLAINGSGGNHTVHIVDDNSWGETTLTWNNRPALGAALDTNGYGAVGEWVAFDVTAALTNHPNAEEFSFAVVSDGGALIDYGTRESDDDAPQLLIETTWGYVDWAKQHNLEQGPEGDDDSDGESNLTEYAFGGDPTNALVKGAAPHYGLVEQGGVDCLVYVHPQRNEPDAGLRYTVEYTDNLASDNWTVVEDVDVAVDGIAPGVDSVTNCVPVEGIQKLFIRLKVD